VAAIARTIDTVERAIDRWAKAAVKWLNRWLDRLFKKDIIPQSDSPAGWSMRTVNRLLYVLLAVCILALCGLLIQNMRRKRGQRAVQAIAEAAPAVDQGKAAAEYDRPPMEVPAGASMAPAASMAAQASPPVMEDAKGEAGTNGNAGYTTTMVVPNSANKIILNKYIETKTKAFDTDLKQLEQALITSGGYIQGSNVSGVKPKAYGEPGRIAYYKFRIPRMKVDPFLSTALKLGEVVLNKDTSEDITAQYMDTESRLKTLRIELDRFQELEKKATKMSDIMELEDKIQQVTYEIESLQGQMRGWDNLVDYATIEMSISEVNTIPKAIEEPKPIDQPDYGTQLGNGFTSVLTGVLEFFKTLVLVIFSGLPIIVPVGVIVAIILISIRAAKKKKTNNTNQM
jgi:hypothetical protein